MKKEYSKPGIIIEDFKLSQHIATCDGVTHETSFGSPQQWSATTCAWKGKGNILIFSTGLSKCVNIQLDEGKGFGQICYNNPSDGFVVFGS